MKIVKVRKVLGFIDCKVIKLARPQGSLPKRVGYKLHKRKHALKSQVVNTPDW